tara:strand:- start:910 stop:1125 length:216 start_codon:yes stop_codon:yes gene_type:complete
MKINNIKYKKALKLIEQIQFIRKRNNINWMDMLRLAFKHDPKNAAKIMSNIYSDDQKVSNIVKKLVKVTKK